MDNVNLTNLARVYEKAPDLASVKHYELLEYVEQLYGQVYEVLAEAGLVA